MFSVLLYNISLPTNKINKISEYFGADGGLWRSGFFSVFCFFACQVESLLMPLKRNFTHYIEIHTASSLFYSLTHPQKKKKKKRLLKKNLFILSILCFWISNISVAVIPKTQIWEQYYTENLYSSNGSRLLQTQFFIHIFGHFISFWAQSVLILSVL